MQAEHARHIARGGIALFRSNFGPILVSSKRSTEFLECASGTYRECESEAGYAVIPGPL
jgi:hypothetical protein